MPQKAGHILKGQKGEDLAAVYLRGKGYEILEKNKRFSRAEVDLICRIGEEIVFVEVKTRSTDYFGYPEESVSKAKQKMLAQAAEAYIEENAFKGELRYDIVSIIIKDNQQRIYHIEDAFYPGWG